MTFPFDFRRGDAELYRPLSRMMALSVAAAAFLLGGCTIERGGEAQTGAQTSAQSGAQTTAEGTTTAPATSPVASGAGTPAGAPAPATPDTATDSLVDPSKVVPDERPRADMRLEVDLKARRLHVYQGQTRTATHPVGVGTAEWPTQTGEWVVSQVVWNPEWIPPRDESWTEDRERKAPGEPGNPLGRAQLIYDPPRTVHGTNQPESVGKAVSHGSLRLRNEVITQLGRQVMEAAGVGEDDAWYRRVQENRTEKVIVDLPRVVPIRVY